MLGRSWFVAIALGAPLACGGSMAATPSPPTWCTDRTPFVLAQASTIGSVQDIAMDDTHLYWRDSAGTQGRILRTPKAGGLTETLVTLNANGRGVAVSGDTVVYGAVSTTSSGYGLYAVARSGGSPVLLADVAAGSLLANATVIAFAHANGVLMTVPSTGGTPTTLWTPPGRSPVVAALDDAHVYVIDEPSPGPSSLYRVPLQGDQAATKLLEAPHIHALALRDQLLYVATYDPSTETVSISSLPASGGAATNIASVPSTSIGIHGTLLAVDTTNVYTDEGGNVARIVAIPRAGGAPAPTDATGGAQGIYTLAVDDAAIYWGLEDEHGGNVMRLCK